MSEVPDGVTINSSNKSECDQTCDILSFDSDIQNMTNK